MCIAEGCRELAVTHPEWDNEYCSIICCYNHCKYAYIIFKTKVSVQTIHNLIL